MPAVTRAKTSTNGRALPKARLITRQNLDGRTRAARRFDEIVEGISADLGGEGELTVIERSLVRAFAGAALRLENMTMQLLLGEEIDLAAHGHAVSSLVRIASRLGVSRRARDVTPDLQSYLRTTYGEAEAGAE